MLLAHKCCMTKALHTSAVSAYASTDVIDGAQILSQSLLGFTFCSAVASNTSPFGASDTDHKTGTRFTTPLES